MKRFIFFTKTMYDETPRIRHQLAELLTSYGHEVVFYQKPLFFFEDSKKLINEKINEKLEIRQTKQLIHHQLRVHQVFHFFNSCYENNQIKKSCLECDKNDVIINFNYDYFFLRKIFKENKIITVINDDFVAQAKFNNGSHVKKSLSKVSKMSDSVLCVSYPLLDQVKRHNKSSKLFLPWSEINYIAPKIEDRKSILVWASINNIIDFEIVKSIAVKFKEFNVFLIGPMDSIVKPVIDEIVNSFKNVIVLDPKGLDELDSVSDFFVGLMPYKSGVRSTEAVTAANKTFRLMSLGLPLIVHGMPSFYEHKAIFKCNNINEIQKAIEYCHDNFYKMQPSIEKLVNAQQPADRYAQIMSIVNEEKSNV